MRRIPDWLFLALVIGISALWATVIMLSLFSTVQVPDQLNVAFGAVVTYMFASKSRRGGGDDQDGGSGDE